MSISFHSPRFLAVYSGVLTVVFAATVLLGTVRGVDAGSAGRASTEARFDEITVERINVVEPDGTLRMVLSSEARFPGLVFEGQEYEHPNRSTAGMLFFNDEGTETGGLTYGGSMDEDGDVSSYGHLSFDPYEQDQVITFGMDESGPNRKAQITIWDRPRWSMEELIRLYHGTPEAERDSVLSDFLAARESAYPRMWLGKSHDGGVSLRLNDAEGRERLVVEVGADGMPMLRFLDDEGEETARFPR